MASSAVLPLKVFKGQDFYVPSFRILVGSRELRVETADIMSVTYSDSLSSIDSFDMTVSNWDAEKLTFKYSDADTFNPWKDVELWMGYYSNGKDERRRMLIGEITTMSPSFPAGGGPTLTIRGLNLFHRFRTKQETMTFFQKKDTQIAQELVDIIAKEINKNIKGLTLQLDPDDAAKNLKTEQKIPYLVMNNQYPILFLMERARRIGYELTMEESAKGSQRVVTLHFRPTSYVTDPTYELAWGTSLISFQPTLQTANQVAEVTVRGWDVRGKTKFEETVKRSELANERVINPSSDLAVTEPSLSQKLEVVADHPIQTKAEAKELAKKTLLQIAQDMVIAKGKTVGLPDLRAGVKVQIKGLGTRFSGPDDKPRLYLITETTHSMGDGGYTTDFTARMEK